MDKTFLDGAKADNWSKDVEAEIEATKQTLLKLQAAINDTPEDDTIYEGIKEVGKEIVDVWAGMFRAYEQVVSAMFKGVAGFFNFISQALDDIAGIKTHE